ncbi:MAG: ribosomal L7Ae/L30e/S12e/Gadd45 family protein [Lachnospiraceae bacterium]|nr:ribosomal L7Ae/L30e/S12e/Gadd45 family protein [Lachnospiraceae bacterium]
MSDNKKKILSYLGLAQRAGKIKSGEFSVEKAIKDGSAQIVIISNDASDNTAKKFIDMCNYRNVPYFRFSDRDELGHATGKAFRVTMAVTDEGFSKVISSCFDNGGSIYSEKESI